MTKFIGRAAALAVAAVLATTVPTAAMAQKKPAKAPSFKFSKAVQPLLGEAQKKQQAGDHAGAIATLAQAEAVPDRNNDDTYMINALRLNSAIATNDNALLERALEGAIGSGKLSPEDETKFRRNLGALALQRNDVAKATAEFEKLLAANPNDPALMAEVAELQFRQGNAPAAVASLNKAIAVKEAAGEKADESWYRRALAFAFDKKLAAETTLATENLVKAYPNATNWRDSLIIFRDTAKFDDNGNIDVMRLMFANGALAGERDYAEYAETAALRGLPGEAKLALDTGVAKGALTEDRPFVKELRAAVNPKVASDKAQLPGLEKEASSAPNGRSALGTADAYLGYGEYAKAAALYKIALAKGSVDADTVNTRLGYALGMAGDKAGAEAALKAIKGPQRVQLAKYYLIWLANKA